MSLKENEICPFATTCKFSLECCGTDIGRNNIFICEYVKDGKLVYNESSYRNPLDKTGNMKVIMEG